MLVLDPGDREGKATGKARANRELKAKSKINLYYCLQIFAVGFQLPYISASYNYCASLHFSDNLKIKHKFVIDHIENIKPK